MLVLAVVCKKGPKRPFHPPIAINIDFFYLHSRTTALQDAVGGLPRHWTSAVLQW